MTRSNRADLYSTIAVGVIVIIITVWITVLRIAEILPNDAVPVLVPLFETTTKLPFGPGGSPVTAEIEQATISVSGMAPITVASLVLAQLVTAATIIAVTVCVGLFCRNMLAGTTFSRTNTRLVFASSVSIVAGWAAASLLTTMGVNGAFAALSEHSYDTMVATIDWLPVLFAMVLSAVALAFRAGERMQRDTEGLV